MSKKFGELVKEYRGKKTLKDLGDEIGISSAYLSDIEKGNRFPSKDKLDKLIKAFDLKDKKKDIFYDLVAKESPNKYKVSGDIAEYIMKNDLQIDYKFYITNQLKEPCLQIMNLFYKKADILSLFKRKYISFFHIFFLN